MSKITISVSVDDAKIGAIDFVITEEMLKGGVKIRKGKKVYHKAIME